MPAATAVADPALNEFEVGGRWFACVPHVDPELLIWVMARSQRPPVSQHDPALGEWLNCIVALLLAATPEDDHDLLLATITTQMAQDANQGLADVAAVFAGLLTLYTQHQTPEIQQTVLDLEQAAAVGMPPRQTPAVRSTVADIERINAKHGRRATGEVIWPDG